MSVPAAADGRPVGDYLARDYESLLQAMREKIPALLPEWRDNANEADFGNVLLQLFAYLGDVVGYYQDRVADEAFLGTARSRRSVIEHLRLIGYLLATAAPSAATLALSVPEAVQGTVTIRQGDAFATRSTRDGPSIRFEYTAETDLVIDFSAVQAAGGRRVFGPPLFRGIEVEQGRRFADELIGTADLRPDQRYAVPHPEVIRRPPGTAGPGNRDVLLVTRQGSVVTSWSLQETLAFSGPGDRHFVLDVDADDQATVVFGDGASGMVPEPGAEIRVTYRTGGGSAGNVPPGAIDTIVAAPQLAVLGAKVANPLAATGGADRESIEHAVRHAPGVFRSLRRAVTAADYEALARSFKGVGKVTAVPSGWNRVTLLVAPAGGGGKVSDQLSVDLTAYLEDKRMLGHVVAVEDVDYVPIHVTAEIGVQPYYVTSDVLTAVQAAAAALLAFDAVEFGQPVYLSAFYERTQEVPGVTFVNITEFRRPGGTPAVEPSGRIVLLPNELPVVPPDPEYRAGLRVSLVGQKGN